MTGRPSAGRAGEGTAGGGDLNAVRDALGSEFEVVQELGKGRMARVFLAKDRGLGRLVAIKVLSPERAADETARKRFEREAKASASLAHPNVVEVYRFGRLPDETPYLVMKFIKGRTMRDSLAAEGRLTEDRVRQVLVEVADALAAAHARGIVHRDVRPGNILWEEERERALLTDFGIAHLLVTSGEDATRLTQAGIVVGDPGYQSPEQLLGEDITEMSDVYALGITGYELLAGEGPFGARSPPQLIRSHLKEEPPDLRSLRPDVDPGLADLLRRCLAKEPRHRPTARDVVRQLTGGAAAPGLGAGPTAPAPGPGGELRKRRIPQVVASTLGVSVVFIGLVMAAVDIDRLPEIAFELALNLVIWALAASAVVAWFHGERGTQVAPPKEKWILAGLALGWLVSTLLVWRWLG